jgi:hypothetical protein
LSYRSRAVHVCGTILENAVEMDRCADIAQAIEDIDNYSISDIGTHGWDGPLIVDSHDTSCESAIWVGGYPGDIEVIGDGGGMTESCKQEQRYWKEKIGQRERHDYKSRCLYIVQGIN